MIGYVFSGKKLDEAANSSDLAERKKFNDTWKNLKIEEVKIKTRMEKDNSYSYEIEW